MISGILTDKRTSTSHNSLTTKEVADQLLNSLAPTVEVEGTEGLFDGIVSAVKKVIKAIVDALKNLWSYLFGKAGAEVNLTKLSNRLDKLKTAKLKSGLLPFKKEALMFTPESVHYDNSLMGEELVTTSGMLLASFGWMGSRLSEIEVKDSTGGIGKHKEVVQNTVEITPNLSVSYYFDPESTAKVVNDGITVDKTLFTLEEGVGKSPYLFLSKHQFEKMVKTLSDLVNLSPKLEKKLNKVTNDWEAFAKALDSNKLHHINPEESANLVNVVKPELRLIQTVATQAGQQIVAFITMLESWVEPT